MRYSLRVLRKNPGFTLIAVLSLALGIGANTAIFTLVHAVILRPLPYPQPDQLLSGWVRIPEYNFWVEHSTAFATTAYDGGVSDRRLTTGARLDWIHAMSISTGFFRTLGIAPAMGREFDASETSRGGPDAVILSDGLWRRTFDADPAVLGRIVTLDDTAYTVVGVLPRDFWFPDAADAFVPKRPGVAVSDEGLNTQMFARLKPGVSLRQFDAERPALTQAVRRLYPNMFPNGYRGLILKPYQDALVGDLRTNLLLLFGAVAVLLLIACSNLAALMLARLAGRRKEIALRLALGSSRRRLLAQFLSENLLLNAAGAIAALAVAKALLKFLVASAPFHLPSSTPIGLDGTVLAFTMLVALATGVVFSIAPLFSATRVDLQDALKSGGRTGGGARQVTRSILVVAEVTLAVTLLVHVI